MPMSAQSISEEQLLENVAVGDPQAMKELVEQFSSLVWGVAKRYISPQHHIEDVAQEVFMELWRKSGQYDRKKSSARTFVALMTKRRCIDWLRKKTKQPAIESIDEANVATVQDQSSSNQHFDHETFVKMLHMLPEDKQELFQLHFKEGMTHSEIAEHIGVSLGTVKTNLRRGLIQLRKLLTSQRGGGIR